jgi:hypothetical protein
MGWRRGEIWLETELGWFRESSSEHGAAFALNAPSFLAFASAGAADVSMPDGLAASRRRRADRRRRRHARRTRAAAALVIAPAAMLTLSGQRFGAGSAGGALQEDPPSMTSHRGVATPPLPTQEHAKPQTREMPQIAWRNATSHGLPYAGSLSDGTQLPLEGPDWVTWSPVDDSSPNEPNRLYGNERTIKTIVNVLADYRAANPAAPRVVVGDISFRHGGPMNEHRSHQNGLDVDVYYPRADGALRAPGSAEQVDRKLSQDLLDRFVAAGAAIVFIGYSTRLHGPGGVVVPYANHENHMHVRLDSHR